MDEPSVIYHRDTDLFRAALRYSAVETGFSERLIEKDYYCSVVLADLADSGIDVAFKGGTCLSKVHADFYRLSEDLDFGLSTPLDATRRQRSERMTQVKSHLASIEERLSVLRVVEPLRGFNNSVQYGGRLAYRSMTTGQDDFIKVEVSVREPVVEPTQSVEARTLLLDPFRRAAAVFPFDVLVLSLRETYAEKIRAALSRRDPAIRDFFDLDHAFSSGIVSVDDDDLLELLRVKLAIPGNDAVDVSPEKLDVLRTQIETQLESVLRADDFGRFDLDRAFQQVAEIKARL